MDPRAGAGRDSPEVPPWERMNSFAIRSQSSKRSVFHFSSGMKIAFFSDKKDAVARSQIERGRRLPALPGLTAVFSSTEELIVKKLQYYQLGGSDKHLRDVRAMLEISGEEIDLGRIGEWVDRLDLAEVWALVSDHPVAEG